MDVSVIGAGGDCGRQIAARIAADRLLLPTDRLQLVGGPGGRSAGELYGLATDLKDANAEFAPQLDVAVGPDDVVADIIVFVAGAQLQAGSGAPVRDRMAGANLPIFREYARAIARHGSGEEVVLVVTNPVELGVEVFARELGRHRVIGIGAYSDSLRFRREIAKDLGVRRQLVHGFALGEHGDGILPAWSTVAVHGMDAGELAARIPLAAAGRSGDEYLELLRRERGAMMELLQRGDSLGAFEHVNRLAPDLRVALKPYATLLSGARTAFATANVVVDLVQTLLDGREIVVAGQVQLAGDFRGLRGVLGVPIAVGGIGGMRPLDVALSDAEFERLAAISRGINAKVEGWLADG